MPFALTAVARAANAGFVPPALVGGAGSDFDDEAQPAFGGGSSAAHESESAPAVFDGEDGPPLTELEAQMGGEVGARDTARSAQPTSSANSPSGATRRGAARASADADDDDADSGSARGAALPGLETLVARLPEEVRATLVELFRAKFIAVKKLPKRSFRPATSKGGSLGS